MKREQGVYYDEETAKQWGECCDKCHDVTFEKTYPAHTAYFACTNLDCECHKAPNLPRMVQNHPDIPWYGSHLES